MKNKRRVAYVLLPKEETSLDFGLEFHMIHCKKIFLVTDQFALNYLISVMISQTIFDKSGFLCVPSAVSGVPVCLASPALHYFACFFSTGLLAFAKAFSKGHALVC